MALDDDSFLWPDTSGAAVLAAGHLPTENAAALPATSPFVEEQPASPTVEDEGFLWPSPAPVAPTVAARVADEPSRADVTESSPAWDAAIEPKEPGSLAAKVMSLRVLEDEISALLVEAERALRSLETQRTLEDAGFRSGEEFRERIAAQMGLLYAMRESTRRRGATGRKRKRPHARARGGDTRARRTLALTVIEQAMGRFRELDLVMRGKVEEARDLLAGIDHGRTFAECGYASFDEFLALAIGPSPILTRCRTVLGEVPPPPEEKPAYVAPPDDGDDGDGLPSLADPPGPLPSDDRPPALFELPPEPASEPARASLPPSEDWPAEPAPRALPARSALVVSIVLGVAAAVIGAAAGVRASHTAEVESAPAEVATAAVTEPAASHKAVPSTAPEAKHGPLVQVASQPTATAARRGDRPVPASVPRP